MNLHLLGKAEGNVEYAEEFCFYQHTSVTFPSLLQLGVQLLWPFHFMGR